MNKFFKSRMIRSMIPYFILALAVIIAFRLTAEFGEYGFFNETFGFFWGVISPFVTGAVIAYILNLPCGGIQHLLNKTGKKFIMKRSRGFSVLILVLFIVILLAIILNMIIPAIVSSVLLLIEEVQHFEATFHGWIDAVNNLDLPAFIPDFNIHEEGIFDVINDFIMSFEFSGVMDNVIAGFGGAMSAVFHTFLAIVSSLYLLVEKDRLKSFVTRLVDAATAKSTFETIMKYSRKLNFNFRQYIYTQTIDGLILGSIMFVVLQFGFRSQFALVLSLILGVLNYIPYFGSIFGTALAVLVIAFTQGLPTAAIATVLMFAIQQFDGNYIQPKLMGGSFSLSPLLIIISVTVGMAYGGVLGMLVAIPIVAILKDMLDSLIEYLEDKKKNPPPPNEFMDREIW